MYRVLAVWVLSVQWLNRHAGALNAYEVMHKSGQTQCISSWIVGDFCVHVTHSNGTVARSLRHQPGNV